MKLQSDKILHFLASGLIFMIILMFTQSLDWAFLIAILVGIGKEIYDYYKKGFADFYDVVADLLGIFFCIFLYFIKLQML